MFTDEFAGQGGSYVVDPKTGKRTLVERTRDPSDMNSSTAADGPGAPGAAGASAPAAQPKGDA